MNAISHASKTKAGRFSVLKTPTVGDNSSEKSVAGMLI